MEHILNSYLVKPFHNKFLANYKKVYIYITNHEYLEILFTDELSCENSLGANL